MATLIYRQPSLMKRKIWIKLAQKADLAIFLNVDLKTANTRETEGSHSMDSTEQRNKIYCELMRSMDITSIANDDLNSCIQNIEHIIKIKSISRNIKTSNIILFSRPLTNNLDEGSKSLIYYLVQNINTPVSIFTTNQFQHPLPSRIHKIPVMDEPQSNIVEDSKSFPTKIKQVFFLLRQPLQSTLHIFFALNPLNALTLLMLCSMKSFKLNITITSIKTKHVSNVFVKKLLMKAQHVIVQTIYTQNRIKHLTQNCHRIHPFIDPRKFSAHQKDGRPLKIKHDLSGDFTIIYPGEYSRLNANNDIISILQETNKRHPNIQFIMLCRLKWRKDRVNEKTLKHKLKDCRVKFLNTVQNIEDYLSLADLIIFPARTMEGKFDHPLVLLESIAAETPILTTNIEPLNEIGSAAVNTNEDFINEIDKMYTDKEYYNQRKDTAIELKKKFTSLSLIHQYEQIYFQN